MKKTLKKIIILLVIVIIAGAYAYGTWERPIYDTDIGSNSYMITDRVQKNVKQTVICPQNGLKGLTIKVNFSNNESINNYSWRLMTENGKTIQQGQFSKDMLGQPLFEKKNILTIEFQKQTNSKDRRYIFEIQNNASQGDEGMSCYMTSGEKYAGKLVVDDNILDESLIIKQEVQMFNVETFIVFMGMAGYIFLFINCMYRLFK